MKTVLLAILMLVPVCGATQAEDSTRYTKAKLAIANVVLKQMYAREATCAAAPTTTNAEARREYAN